MNQVTAVSLFNKNNYNINDLDDDLVSKSILVFFCVDQEFQKNELLISDTLVKFKNYLRVNIEDLDWTLEEDRENYPNCTDEEIFQKYELGDFEYPNKETLSKIKEFIRGNESVVVACSAGISRTGALVQYLVENNYTLNKKYNQRFIPNELILKLLKELGSIE